MQITNEEIDIVEQHVERFGPDKANQMMVNRIACNREQSLQAPTKYDVNFYTHELREFERYRNLGGKRDNRRIRYTLPMNFGITHTRLPLKTTA